MSIPAEYLAEGTKLAEGMRVFGAPVTEMTKEELIACLALASVGLRRRDEREREHDTHLVRALRQTFGGR